MNGRDSKQRRPIVPRRRSDELAAVDEVMPLVDKFNELNHNQQSIFLDMIDPLPDELPAKPTKKKTSRKDKSARAKSLAGAIGGTVANSAVALDGNRYEVPARCVAPASDGPCGEYADANVHHLESANGYHEFQPALAQVASGD